MVREHFANVNEWKRWSDYSVNDVDDGITACVVLYSHMTVSNEELNDLEKRSKNKFQEIVDTWFGDLTEPNYFLYYHFFHNLIDNLFKLMNIFLVVS